MSVQGCKDEIKRRKGVSRVILRVDTKREEKKKQKVTLSHQANNGVCLCAMVREGERDTHTMVNSGIYFYTTIRWIEEEEKNINLRREFTYDLQMTARGRRTRERCSVADDKIFKNGESASIQGH